MRGTCQEATIDSSLRFTETARKWPRQTHEQYTVSQYELQAVSPSGVNQECGFDLIRLPIEDDRVSCFFRQMEESRNFIELRVPVVNGTADSD